MNPTECRIFFVYMIVPSYLKAGDKVALLATARKVSAEEIQPAVSILKSWGLEVEYAPNLFAVDNQFAGTDQQRTSDLQWAINHKEIKAVICARGGYGTTRIIDSIDFSNVRNYPKWFCGFSDITALHFELQKTGLESLHSIMLMQMGQPGGELALNSLKDALFGNLKEYSIPPHQKNKFGSCTGQLIGGNLSIINHLIGTSSISGFEGKILFIEDIDEYLYHIDRLLLQLDRADVFSAISGLVVGHFTKMNDNIVPFGKSAYGIVKERISAYNFPVCYGFPVGHESRNMAMYCGREASLTVNDNGARVSFSKLV